MLIYLAVFLVSALLICLGDKVKQKGQRYVVYALALLIPCLLAGLRSSEIGTDVQVYVTQLFEGAKSSASFSEFYQVKWWESWHYKYVSEFEIGFTVLTYLTAKIFNDIHILLFFIQALTIFPVFVALGKYKALKRNRHIAMLVYYLMLYNISLNAMRQFIAMSMVFLGISIAVNQKKPWAFWVTLCIGFLFHKSSLLGIAVYLLYYLLSFDRKESRFLFSKKQINIRVILVICISLFMTFLCFNLELSTKILSMIGFSKYNVYIKGNYTISIAKIILKLPIVSILILSYKKYRKTDENYLFYCLVLVLEFFISNLSSINVNSARVGYIFQYFYMVFFPTLCISTRSRKIEILYKSLIIAYLLIYWVYYYVLSGANETVPYLFFWQVAI